MHLNLPEIIGTIGYLGVTAIIFAESGLFFGFFLPGDSLIVTAGLLATQGYFNIVYLMILLPIAAITGDSVGYWFGKKVGPRIFKKKDSLLFNINHITRAQEFYKKHGGKTIIIARFLPVIRTFAPIVAGVGNMEYSKFLTYNIIGGLVWCWGMLILGYFLGSVIPDVDKYLLPIIFVIIVVSLLPSVIENRHGLMRQFKKALALVKNSLK